MSSTLFSLEKKVISKGKWISPFFVLFLEQQDEDQPVDNIIAWMDNTDNDAHVVDDYTYNDIPLLRAFKQRSSMPFFPFQISFSFSFLSSIACVVLFSSLI